MIKNKQKNIPKLRFLDFGGIWEENKLEQVAIFLKGKGISKEDISKEGKNKCIRYGELYTHYNEVVTDVRSKTNISKDKSLESKKKDLINPSSGETSLDIARFSCVKESGVLLGGDLNVIRLKDQESTFFAYYLSNFKNKSIARLAQGNSVVHLYPSHLKTLKINFPSLLEQQKISSFLMSIDDWIQNLKSQKNFLEKYKKGMIQKIFSQEVRFKDDKGNDFEKWNHSELGDYLIHISDRNKDYSLDLVLSISNKFGFITQTEQFEDHRVASKDVSNYKIVNKNDFAYNPSRINIGSIACLKKIEKGIVSPMYVVFRLKKLNSVFFENYIKTHRFAHMVKVGCSGSVRDSLSFDDLATFKVTFPSIFEQQKIAEFLTSLDKVIDSKQEQIKFAEEWKRGLMQGLFV